MSETKRWDEIGDTPSRATNSAGPMFPEPPECGVACGACEALAHEAARLKADYNAAQGQIAELEAEVARLREALQNVSLSLSAENIEQANWTIRAALAGEAKP